MKVYIPGEHGGVGTFTGGHAEARSPNQCPFVRTLIDYQGTTTVSLAGRLNAKGSFECADHLRRQAQLHG